ncbi:putative methylase [Candidatus Termititenax persephonae]|uniref:Methylase n=1 Tax=Candidatus Termititenax persephonae TaxID=2218525 RepID=A0A388TGV7_9BACT|nr:putative methylase [Candidatus Termititenax persephonae]
MLPDCEISAVEINKKATQILHSKGFKVYNQSILDFNVDYKRDFVFIKTVLIHINPEELQNVYQKLYDASSQYIMIAEYYNPTPVEVLYRGHSSKLFKRDFAGEMLDKFSNLKLVDYGFTYHRDNYYCNDDLNWFLLEKLDD